MNVFDDLREAFRQAVENFKRELNRDDVTDAVDELLREMRQEVVDAQAYIHGLEDDMQRASAQAKREAEEANTCRRRESMAKEIGDAETARIAGEFAERYEKRKAILERKASTLAEEIALRRTEVQEMLGRLEEAGRKREELRSRAGTTRAREALRSDDLFHDLDRLGEQIENDARYARAAGELGEMFSDGPEKERSDSVADVEERLRELKRKMEVEGDDRADRSG